MAKQKVSPRAEIDPGNVSPLDVCIAYKQVFSAQEGQIVMADLLRHFGFSRNSTFNVNPGSMAYNEGQRSVLIHVGRMLDADPTELEEARKSTGEM